MTGSPPAAITLNAVSKRFSADGPTILETIDLRVEQGEFVCLLGASGCGKSTILNLIAGLDHPSSGSITVPGGPVAMMFQDPALLPWLTASRNVELALEFAGVSRPERRERVRSLLELVSLSHAGERRPHQLSGGMRQRVALARALAQDSSVLLMDEPFAAIDAITRDNLHRELERIWRHTRQAVVFVTHNVREALRLGQRIVLLHAGPGRFGAEWSVPDAVRTGADPLETARLEGEITRTLRGELSEHAA